MALTQAQIDRARAIRAAMDAAGGALPDDVALTAIEMYRPWVPGEAVAVGDRRKYGGQLYRCVQAHTAQADWTPDTTPALWTRVSVEAWPDWVQPIGASDAYNMGDRVTFNSTRYISAIDGNVWSPTDYPAGWTAAQ